MNIMKKTEKFNRELQKPTQSCREKIRKLKDRIFETSQLKEQRAKRKKSEAYRSMVPYQENVYMYRRRERKGQKIYLKK